jgi:aspartate kinase
MGKTTNALEKIAAAYYKGNLQEALELFDIVKKQHVNISKYLLVNRFNQCMQELNDFFTEAEWLMHDKPVRDYNYYYDQIVCTGELCSSAIVSHYLNEIKIYNTWLDVRDIIRTDNIFREATIDWNETKNKITSAISDKWQTTNIYITQGFIGATDENESTTLGREGSDFTAAVFASILNADSVTIWKDVEGVMNADPKKVAEAQLISELSFDEVIEMAFYGAQVIHPKTIKPLQNKGIPLFVKSFIQPQLAGTIIHYQKIKNLPPIIVIKDQQALIELTSTDFSFVAETSMTDLYNICNRLRIKPNLIQTGAISVQICIDTDDEKIQKLATASSKLFDMQVRKELQLLTVRHHTKNALTRLLQDKEVLLFQQTSVTTQVVLSNAFKPNTLPTLH